MAVTAFDGQFSFRQDTLARLGRAPTGGMTAAQAAKFNESPFMQTVRRTESLADTFTGSRDEKRRRTDPSFRPSNNDFKAPKAFDFDKAFNYYAVLGVDEYATLAEVKKAYRTLSLIYHPDKTNGLSDEQKEEHQGIFIELNNAYQTLSDNPTRRQYDRDRDRDKASFEISGYKIKKKAHFDATEVLKRLREAQRPPGKTVDVPAQVSLEKFFHGGLKGVRRKRAMLYSDRSGRMPAQEARVYRINIPQGAAEPHSCIFKNQGDQHVDTLPDTLSFLVRSKPHDTVERQGPDLVLKRPLHLGSEAHLSPYLSAQTPSVRGRHVLLWGRNPFFKATGAGGASLRLHIRGEGVGPGGCLRLDCRLGAAAQGAPREPEAAASPAGLQSAAPGHVWGPRGRRADTALSEYEGVVAVEHVDTGARVFVRGTEDTTMGELRERLGEVLNLPKGSMVRLMQGVPEGYTPFSDKKALGGLRSLKCGGAVWHGPPDLDAERSLEFLEEVLSIAEASPPPTTLAGLEWMLPDYGLEPSAAKLQERVDGALRRARGAQGNPEAEDDVCGRMEVLLAQLAAQQARSARAAAERAAAAAEAERPRGAPHGDELAEGPARHGAGGPRGEQPAALLRRARARAAQETAIEAELVQHGHTVTLFTRPTCSITFYTSSGRPFDLFAVAVSSPPCAKKVAAAEWAKLKERLLPVLESTAFFLLREARAALPRRVCCEAALAPARGGEGTERYLKMPWNRLGREAYCRGDFFSAMSLYSHELEELRLAGGHEGDESVALSNRAACLARIGHHEAALEDARRSRDLRPAWGRAWSRIGASAAALGQQAGGVQPATLSQEACQACFKAVELEPSAGSIKALEATIARAARADPELAHEEKENGNRALRANEVGLAVAHYTRAIASTPPPQGATDDYSMLRAVLRSNRAGALCRLRCWTLALADARQAVACREDFAKAHAKLGTALLGCGETERAYAAFARSLVLDPRGDTALRGRQACITTLPAWQSVPARRRIQERFGRDLCRPSGSSKVYCISDVHFDHKCNEEWAHSIDDFRFQEDVLIVAGNVCDSRNALVRGLTTLKAKFRRVFYVPGNHETWIHPSETSKYPDSLAKLLAIMETCDELDVDVFPAAIAHDVFIVPLLSWYSAEFDYEDPYPALDGADKYSKWPLDPDAQLWKYMLKMNEAHFRHPYHGTVITFSHFLPRRDLPFKSHGNAAKSMGCTQLDEQIRKFNARKHIHVYGHSQQSYHALKEDIWYVNMYHGQEAGHSDRSPIFLLHDGESAANRCVHVTDGSRRPA